MMSDVSMSASVPISSGFDGSDSFGPAFSVVVEGDEFLEMLVSSINVESVDETAIPDSVDATEWEGLWDVGASVGRLTSFGIAIDPEEDDSNNGGDFSEMISISSEICAISLFMLTTVESAGEMEQVSWLGLDISTNVSLGTVTTPTLVS